MLQQGIGRAVCFVSSEILSEIRIGGDGNITMKRGSLSRYGTGNCKQGKKRGSERGGEMKFHGGNPKIERPPY